MYARVAVASNALDLGNLQLPVANALHGSLVEALLSHGRLVFTSNQEALEFVRAVKETAGMSQDARTRWTALLHTLKATRRIDFTESPSEIPLSQVAAIDLLRAQWGASADVAIVSTVAGAALGVPEDTGLLSDPAVHPDVAVPAAAPTATAFRQISDLEQLPVAAHGSSRESFWESVLKPMATGAVSATILDAYLFKRLSEIAHGRYRAPRGGEQVTWLLQHLDSVMSRGATVRLFGDADKVYPDDDPDTIAAYVRDHWRPPAAGRLARVEVWLGSYSPGKRFPHDRHVRFSTGSALKLGAGFDRLREEWIWDPAGLWWSFHWQRDALRELQKVEGQAQTLARHPGAFVIRRE